MSFEGEVPTAYDHGWSHAIATCRNVLLILWSGPILMTALVSLSRSRARRGSRFAQHFPPLGIDCFAAPGHVSEHVEPPLHATVHGALAHVTSHVAPFVHVTVANSATLTVHVELSQLTSPLVPVSIAHVEWFAQIAVHCVVQLPVHALPVVHWSEQSLLLMLQLALPSHVQSAPGHAPP